MSVRPWSDGLAEAEELLRVDPRTACAQAYPPSRPTEVRLSILCPACGHPTETRHVLVPEDLKPPARQAFERLVAFRCQCVHAHPGSPPSVTGCGFPIAATLRRAALSGPVRVGGAAPPSLLAISNDAALAARQDMALPKTRDAAHRWQAALGGLITLSLAFFALKGASAVSSIHDTDWRRGFMASLFVAFGFAVFASYRATRASVGNPGNEYLGDAGPLHRLTHWGPLRAALALVHLRTMPSDINSYGSTTAWDAAFAKLAAADLRLAKLSTMTAVGVFAVAALILWTKGS